MPLSIHRLSSIKRYGTIIVFNPVITNKGCSSSEQDASRAKAVVARSKTPAEQPLLEYQRVYFGFQIHGLDPASVSFFWMALASSKRGKG